MWNKNVLDKWNCTTLWFSPYKENMPTVDFNVLSHPDCSESDYIKLLELYSHEIVTLIHSLVDVQLIVQGQLAHTTIVCGSKNWRDYDIIYERISRLPKNSIILEGGYPGVDTYSRIAALDLGLEIVEFPSKWLKSQSCHSRGPNSMFRGKRNLVLAFHNDIHNADGTKRIIEEARKRSIPTEVIMA